MNPIPNPVTSAEWVELCDDIAELWPGTKSWTGPNTARLYSRFEHFPAASIRAAINNLYHEGRQSAPSSSTLMKATRDHVAANYGTENLQQIAPEEPIVCNHSQNPYASGPLGIFSYHPGTDAPREVFCPRCRKGYEGGWVLPAPSRRDETIERIAP